MHRLCSIFVVFFLLQPDLCGATDVRGRIPATPAMVSCAVLTHPLVSTLFSLDRKARAGWVKQILAIGRFIWKGDPEINQLPFAPSSLVWIDIGLMVEAALTLTSSSFLSPCLIDAAVRGAPGISATEIRIYAALFLLSVLALPFGGWLKGRLRKTTTDFSSHLYLDVVRFLLYEGNVDDVSNGLGNRLIRAIKPVSHRSTVIRYNLRHISYELLGGIVVLFYLDPWITAVVLFLTTTLTAWLNQRSAMLEPPTEAVRLSKATLDPLLQETFHSDQLRHTRANNLEEETLKVLQQRFMDIYEKKVILEAAQWKLSVLQTLFSGSILMAGITLFCATTMYYFQTPTIGILLAILSVSAHIQFRFTTLADHLRLFQNTEGSAKDLFSLLSHRRPLSRSVVINNGDISCAHVHFAIGQQEILNNITFTLRAGEMVLVRGHNNAGKTTLLRLLAGLETPTAGDIRIGGYRPQDTVSSVALVNQEYSLRNTLTLRENLKLAAPHAQDAVLRSALSEAGVRFVRGLADGLDSSVKVLSGGERQSIALACALLRKPKILLFDEPLSALDAERRRQFEHTLERLQKQGYTLVIVTHIDLTLPARVLTLHQGILQSDWAFDQDNALKHAA